MRSPYPGPIGGRRGAGTALYMHMGVKIYTHMHFLYVYVSYPYIHAIHTFILEYIHICTCRFTDEGAIRVDA